MLRLFLILIGVLLPWRGTAGPCPSSATLVVISPRTGITIPGEIVAVRGFLCENSPVVLVKNKTTATTNVAETNAQCDQGTCIYTFATLVRHLAPGPNELSATTPSGQGEITIQVIRTALAAE